MISSIKIVLFLPLILLSCDSSQKIIKSSIEGDWMLIEIHKNQMAEGYQNTLKSTNFEKHQVVYSFKKNGNLVIKGDTLLIHTPGTYKYILEEDYIGKPHENQAKELLLKIDDVKWSFTQNDNEIIIGQAFLDGPELTLKRKSNR